MKKLILLVCGVLLVVGFMARVAYQQIFISSASEESVEVTVLSGDSARIIGEKLREKKLIKSLNLFLTYSRYTNAQTGLKAGVYVIPRGSSIKTILSILTQGKVRRSDIVITVKEGWSITDIATWFEYNGIAMREEFMERVGFPGTLGDDIPDYSRTFPILGGKPPRVSYEGYLFPDTYFLSIDRPLENYIEKSFANLTAKIPSALLDEMRRQGKTLHEVLTLASIVEKEAPRGEEAKVAGVFINRLRIGMGLQSDPTVNYVTGKVTDRPTLNDTAIDSPWNTYKYRGLPPSPISNPGITAIRAAIYPESHEYFYFLNPPGGGELIYAKTFEEHKANREKYLK